MQLRGQFLCWRVGVIGARRQARRLRKYFSGKFHACPTHKVILVWAMDVVFPRFLRMGPDTEIEFRKVCGFASTRWGAFSFVGGVGRELHVVLTETHHLVLLLVLCSFYE